MQKLSSIVGVLRYVLNHHRNDSYISRALVWTNGSPNQTTPTPLIPPLIPLRNLSEEQRKALPLSAETYVSNFNRFKKELQLDPA